MTTNKLIIKPREREAIIRSLRSGVVPSVGLHHIQVGRSKEIQSFLRDIDTIIDDGASFRFVIGEYGSGKTFFLSLARSMAMERGLVTMQADLSPQKRLHSNQGHARRLLTELIASLSTRTKKDGNALTILLQSLQHKLDTQKENIHELLYPLTLLPIGNAFAKAIEIYLSAENHEQRQNALQWLQAQYPTRTDSIRALGIREILDDASLFPSLILYATFARLAGYKGLYVCIDELVNLYKITNAQARKANYEDILSMLNNTLQGNIHGLGIVMSGTPEFLTDPRRGLYSYEALRSRLAENDLSSNSGLADYDSTVLRLSNLSKEELLVLLKNIRRLYASEDPNMESRIPDEALIAFLQHCFSKIGESYFRTPRNTIKAFIDMASLLRQYPNANWQSILSGIDIDIDVDPSPLSSSAPQPQNDLVDFRL